MARGICTFRQRDVTAAVKAVVAADVAIARVELDKSGKIVIIAGRANDDIAEAPDGRNEWDSIS